MSTSTSATSPDPAAEPARFPTETEIYLLPDGRVIVADLPAELAAALARLGAIEPCALPPSPAAERHT